MVIFWVKVIVRISFRVRVLGNSDHCVLKFNSMLAIKYSYDVMHRIPH